MSPRDRLLISLRLAYPPDLSRAQREQLAERLRRTGTSLVFGYALLLIAGIIDLAAAIATKNPAYFVIGVVFVVAGYLLYRHLRAVREAVRTERR